MLILLALVGWIACGVLGYGMTLYDFERSFPAQGGHVGLAVAIGMLGPLDKGAAVAGYLGMVLMCATYSAIGLMASSFTKNQIVAAVIALFIGFFLFIIGQMIPVLPPSVAPLANAISIHLRFQNIARGVIDTRDVLYFVTVIAICLGLAFRSLESRRWK